jgi:NitT/TauT family transport system ATP-binding protein
MPEHVASSQQTVAPAAAVSPFPVDHQSQQGLRNARRALDQVSLSARCGEFLSILGPSGCDKSTLMMIVAGLVPASGGVVMVESKPVIKPRTNIGIVFQSPVLLKWRTVLANIMLQAEARKLDRRDAERRACEFLRAVGLAGFEKRYPLELSGGMRQRVSICRRWSTTRRI